MPCITYREKRFNKSSRTLIDLANKIIADYRNQGFRLTLRQLYYQFVSRDLIANTLKEYKRLGSVFMVLTFCPPGGTVLDPFGGSGTVAAVCKLTGRNSVSIDCRQSQIELTERRVAEAAERLAAI